MLPEITPLILTFNEALNIGRGLERLTWATRIVVVDSFSTDETEALCRKFPQVDFVQRKFDDHTTQWNFGLDQIKTEWVLTLDADYVLSEELVAELKGWRPTAATVAAFASFRYCVLGRPLRATLYPARAVLFRARAGRYEPDGHTQKLAIQGPTTNLASVILHDDRKPLAHWLWAQDRYAALEVKKLLARTASELPVQDRVRRWILPAPFLVLFYTLIWRGLILDGWPGWYYAFQRTLAEMILSLRLLEQKLKH
jgi:glycosyltransferase involved in cell wall biosynthesis